MPQTNIQKKPSIRFGSGLLEVGDDFNSLVNIGAIRGLSYNSKKEDVEIPFDNTESIERYKNGLDASFTFELAEIDFTTLQKMEDGWMVVGTTAAALVPGAVQVYSNGSWLELNFLPIENQNGDGSALTINSVTGSVDGALVANDDYEVVKNSQGLYGIVLNLAGTLLTTEAQDITINYDYTPNASKDITFKDFGNKVTKVARLTNTDENGSTLVINLTSVTNITQLTMPFVSDDADDVSVVAMELNGTIVDIVDEQSTT